MTLNVLTDHILELQLITSAMERANVAYVWFSTSILSVG